MFPNFELSSCYQDSLFFVLCSFYQGYLFFVLSSCYEGSLFPGSMFPNFWFHTSGHTNSSVSLNNITICFCVSHLSEHFHMKTYKHTNKHTQTHRHMCCYMKTIARHACHQTHFWMALHYYDAKIKMPRLTDSRKPWGFCKCV